MNDAIKCSTCPMMKVTGRAIYTRNNGYMAKPRGRCCCNHDDAEAAFKIVCPKSPRMPGFIAFTDGATDNQDSAQMVPQKAHEGAEGDQQKSGLPHH